MKSSSFGSRQRYEFAKCLQDADYSRHSWDLYPIWAECASLSLRQGVHKLLTGSINDELEAQYMRLIKGIKKPERFAEALGVLTLGLEDEPGDFLGKTLGEWGILSKWNGQFFTPDSLCRLMADMNVRDIKPDPNHRFTIQEPACGAGAMTIQVAQALKENGFHPWNYYIVAMDLDKRMFHTCLIQLTLLDVPATVINMNTLSLEEFDRDITFAAARHPWREPTQEVAPPEQTTISQPAPESATAESSLQLSLF